MIEGIDKALIFTSKTQVINYIALLTQQSTKKIKIKFSKSDFTKVTVCHYSQNIVIYHVAPRHYRLYYRRSE